MPRADQTPKMIQDLLAQADRLLDQAAALADEISVNITFRGMSYVPSRVVPGEWDQGGENGVKPFPSTSEDDWQSSGGMMC